MCKCFTFQCIISYTVVICQRLNQHIYTSLDKIQWQNSMTKFNKLVLTYILELTIQIQHNVITIIISDSRVLLLTLFKIYLLNGKQVATDSLKIIGLLAFHGTQDQEYVKKVLYTNIDQILVNSLHRLLNCEIGGLDCRCYYNRV